jgi:PAS domain S-box-containing protein
MNSIVNFIQDLFSPAGFMARWVCGQWTPFHGWLYILSSLAIWLAYFTIPALLFLLLRKKKDLSFGSIFWLFIIFIFACGLTHLADSIMFWVPAYRISALLLFFTAIVSWLTVIRLYRILPELLALQTPAQVQAVLQKQFDEMTLAVQQNEERWQLALAGNKLGVWDWNLAEKEIFYSPRWKEVLGYEKQDLKNQFEEWEQRIHPEDKDQVLAAFTQHLSGQTPAYKSEHRLRGKKGNYKWVAAAGVVTSRSATGEAQRIVGTLEDIHAAKVFSDMLQLSEKTFSSAFHFSGIGIAFVSPTGAWADVNPALCQLVGYRKEELLQMAYQDITHPDDLEADQALVRKMLAKEIKSYQIEKRYFHKNGQLIWVMLTVSLVWGAEGEPQFFIAQIVDISTTKYLIGALEQKNESLHMTALDLEGKMKQLEDFNNIVAHNLRGPAGNIQTLLSMMPRSVPGITENPVYNMLVQATGNLRDTLGDLLKVIEVKLNRNIAFEECHLEEILTKILTALGIQISVKKAVIEKHLQVPLIRYPKVYLESILYNLVSNALKYADPERAPVIEINTHFENNRVVLTVKDNGLGIDLKKHGEQIFKLNKVFHKGFDSRGVGLFMTKNQLETFGGQIAVRSQPGEGTAFTVRF